MKHYSFFIFGIFCIFQAIQSFTPSLSRNLVVCPHFLNEVCAGGQRTRLGRLYAKSGRRQRRTKTKNIKVEIDASPSSSSSVEDDSSGLTTSSSSMLSSAESFQSLGASSGVDNKNMGSGFSSSSQQSDQRQSKLNPLSGTAQDRQKQFQEKPFVERTFGEYLAPTPEGEEPKLIKLMKQITWGAVIVLVRLFVYSSPCLSYHGRMILAKVKTSASLFTRNISSSLSPHLLISLLFIFPSATTLLTQVLLEIVVSLKVGGAPFDLSKATVPSLPSLPSIQGFFGAQN